MFRFNELVHCQRPVCFLLRLEVPFVKKKVWNIVVGCQNLVVGKNEMMLRDFSFIFTC